MICFINIKTWDIFAFYLTFLCGGLLIILYNVALVIYAFKLHFFYLINFIVNAIKYV